ncbi:RNA polymerase sigma-70 factor, ECF subfamily [Flavobacterium sp. 9AF]|uniref:RNA polymerase sigma factor n=1 Tax=Flavobacterium sp. 9AF TaxID=2653142 RepID=UPI0012F3C250|nr:sigma-70 family RNA polymerase sigma factor [Flavobacterium sp. 9AF]VXC07913.1 RNA polymerase sigma-70 factor, ECF subfamily [Flavobacterium sp. 9AF]
MEIQEQFNQLFQNYYPKVFRLCKGYFSGNHHLAEEITQEIFIIIWEKLNTFRNESSISTWIYRITVNRCLLYLRNKKTKNDIATSSFKDITDENESDEKEAQLKKMYDCIQKLDETNKMIILMVLENIDYDKISEIIGITEENLRVKIHRIKKKLTQCVQI